jgi:alkylated DNA repair dioxygenase AlkB
MKKALTSSAPPKQVKSIKGLYYIPNVIKDSKAFINELDKRKWLSVSDSEKSRRVQHYGYRYDYISRRVGEPIDSIPEALLPLQKILTEICLKQDLIDETYVFNQCIVNEYEPGQGISKHVDHKAYGKVIGCFTLGSGASMVFQKGDDKESVYVDKDSLYIMTGEARNDWTHEMPSRKSNFVDRTVKKRGRRISVTFREIKR